MDASIGVIGRRAYMGRYDSIRLIGAVEAPVTVVSIVTFLCRSHESRHRA